MKGPERDAALMGRWTSERRRESEELIEVQEVLQPFRLRRVHSLDWRETSVQSMGRP